MAPREPITHAEPTRLIGAVMGPVVGLIGWHGFDGSDTRVAIVDSELSGSPGHTLSVSLSDAGDSIAVHDSTLDFPGSIGLRVVAQGDSAEGGALEILDSHFRALNPEAGMLFGVAEAGFARLEHFTWQLDEGRPVLFAGTCVIRFPNETKALCQAFDPYEPGSPYDQS